MLIEVTGVGYTGTMRRELDLTEVDGWQSLPDGNFGAKTRILLKDGNAINIEESFADLVNQIIGKTTYEFIENIKRRADANPCWERLKELCDKPTASVGMDSGFYFTEVATL